MAHKYIHYYLVFVLAVMSLIGQNNGFSTFETHTRRICFYKACPSSALSSASTKTTTTRPSTLKKEIIPEDEDRSRLKKSLLELSYETKRGFFASSTQRSKAKDIIEKLGSLNPTLEPASSYYSKENKLEGYDIDFDKPTITGQWTLVYTNAPDITSLDPNTNFIPSILPPSAKLGRIGQDCDATKSTISNVIEWTRPDWVNSFIQDDMKKGSNNRILQKVVCEARANPKEPNIVELELVGFELLGELDEKKVNETNEKEKGQGILSFLQSGISPQDFILKGPPALLKRNPIQLRGPLKSPFGRFKILYLDDVIRIIRTNQGYFAVNIRNDKSWF